MRLRDAIERGDAVTVKTIIIDNNIDINAEIYVSIVTY